MGRSLPTGRGYGNAIADPLLLRHPAALTHDTGAHPERAERIRVLEEFLAEREWLGWEVRESPAASEEQLERVHTAEHVQRVREHCAAGLPLDGDTPVVPASWEAGLRAAGGACALVDALLEGGVPTGLSAHRPPGHHAEPDRAMGFCLFSSIAIAARHALAAHGLERVMIVDWDVHHGNGTAAAFEDAPEVLFASIHQWPFYPGTGALDETGSGAGEGYTLNLPVPAGSGEEEWLGLVEHVIVPVGRDFAPQLILISAGFDAHADDPLGSCELEASSFAQMALQVRGLAGELGVPFGAVLEGGYDTAALAESVAATMQALAAGGEPRGIEPGELVRAQAGELSRHWPVLSA